MSSLEDFMVLLDFEAEPWIFVLDLASIHRAAEFRAKVPKHILIVYIPSQSTSYCQPCDVAMCRTWKSVLAAAANESFAESVVDGQNIKTTSDLSLMHLKRRSVVGAENATLHVQNRIDLQKSARKHVSWESDEDFARLVTQARVMHDANQLFIPHADQPAEMHQPRVATPSTNTPSSTWTKRKSQRRRRKRRTNVLQHPPVPATLVQPSSANGQWTSSWPCASSMAKDPRVKRACWRRPAQSKQTQSCWHVGQR